MAPELSVILVNYNTDDDLRRCVASLDAGIGSFEWDGVIIDNASVDGSGEVAGSGARVRLCRNRENVGFARGVNQGLAMTSGRYALVINQDCELLPGAIPTLRVELDRHPDCTIVGPKVVDPDGAIQGSARGDPTMLTGLFGRTSVLTRLFQRSRLAEHNVRRRAAEAALTSVEVDWVAGSCLLARRDALDAVGGFDERFLLCWEDADLCRRLRARGGGICYVPGAQVVHRVWRSSRTASALAIRAFHASAYLYYITHVARSPLNPARWLANVALRVRCAWCLFRAGAGPLGDLKLSHPARTSRQ